MKNLRVGILATIDSPLSGYIIGDLLKINSYISAIIFDSKILSKKDQNIFKERTGIQMGQIVLSEFENELIPTYFLKNHNSELTIELVHSLRLDLLVNAGTPRILKSEFLSAPSIGVINCHPGLLPKYRGCTCVEWAIYNDDQVGNTTHIMNEGIDEGPILLKEGLVFRKKDSYQDIRTKVFKAGSKLIARTVNELQSEKIPIDRFKIQGKGKYHKVIDTVKMSQVLKKIESGLYKYQI